MTADHLLAWGPSQVTFRVPETLSAHARVELTTAEGSGSVGRGLDVVLHRTELVSTPFSQLVAGPQTVAQGLTRLELRGVPPNTQGIGGPTLLELGDGGFAAAVLFPNDGGAFPTLLQTGDDRTRLDLVLEPRLADPTRWQPVVSRADPMAGAPASQWVEVAGTLVDVFGQSTARLDTQFTTCPLLQRSGGAPRAGVPDQFTTSDGGTFAVNPFGVSALTGWTSNSPCQPVYGAFASPTTRLGVAGGGGVVLATGALTSGAAGFSLSADGRTFAALISAQTALGRTGTALVDPVWAGSLASPTFIVAERALGTNGAYRTSLHAISTTGVLTPDVGVLPAAFAGDAPGAVNRVLPAVDGTRVALFFSNARTLVVGDLSGAAPVAFTVQPGGEAARVNSTWFDAETGDLYAVLVDGQVRRATRAGAWLDWATVDLGFELEVPTRVVPLSLARAPGSRRWLVAAQLFDARPGSAADAGSPIARCATLLGPVPP